MRFRLSQKDAIISDVVMRIYFPEMTSQGKLEAPVETDGKGKKKPSLPRGISIPVSS